MNRAAGFIPNEEKLNIKPYIVDLKKGEVHAQKIEKFSNKYNLGITSESLGLKAHEYFGWEWQQALSSLGHVFISFDSIIFVFLPEKLSDGQKNWFNEYKYFFQKHNNSLAFVITSKERNTLEAMEYLDCENVCDEMYKYINNGKTFEVLKRNISYKEYKKKR